MDSPLISSYPKIEQEATQFNQLVPLSSGFSAEKESSLKHKKRFPLTIGAIAIDLTTAERFLVRVIVCAIDRVCFLLHREFPQCRQQCTQWCLCLCLMRSHFWSLIHNCRFPWPSVPILESQSHSHYLSLLTDRQGVLPSLKYLESLDLSIDKPSEESY